MSDLEDHEIDAICAGLVQNAAKVRYLRRMGLTVRQKPNGIEMFADVYPHEAAEQDWPRFVAYFRVRVGEAWTEAEIRKLLAET